VAVASIDKNNWFVALFDSFRKMLLVELAILEGKAAISIFIRIMNATSESGAVLKVSKVGEGGLDDSFFSLAMN
jgi:hypothetical protein